MIHPDLERFGRLQPGIHPFTLDEIEEQFCFNDYRKKLFQKAKKAIGNLIKAGVRDIYLDGSFAEGKAEPNDIDGCWVADPSVDRFKIDPVLLDFSNERKAMKDKYGVDFFLGNWVEEASGRPFVEFFQKDRNGDPKGIIKIKLE